MASRIKEIRKKKGMTLLQVAERLGVSESTVQRYESGNIKNLKYETMVALSNLFGCSPSYLMGWDESNNSNESSFSDTSKEYYEDPETARRAQKMYEDRDMRMLYDMKQRMTPERFARQMETFRDMYRLEHPEEFPEDWTD